MKIWIAAAVLLLVLSGCAAQEAPAPVALQTQESATAEASPAESGEMDEPEQAESTEPASEATSEPTSEPTAEATAESTTEATAQAQQTTEASPSPTATPTPIATPTPTPSPSPTPTPTETVVAGFTMAEVEMNNTAVSCWVAIDGRVFDLTQWILRHPGGAGAITQLCGTDGTASFTARHGGQARPSATLDSYDIGPLR